MNPYCLGVDVWEGSLDIDEQILFDGGVRFLIIRLNSIDGSTHKDANFGKQWEQAEHFYRAPYFVYNPWLTGKQNVEWLGDNLPAGCKRVYHDIEVKRTNYSPANYAAEVEIFYRQASKFWTSEIYTGQWFLPILLKWPEGAVYWWGRYPSTWYPANSIQITWEAINAKAKSTAWYPYCQVGKVNIWQCSGDRMKPPGCRDRAIDINLFNGDETALATYWGAEPVKSWAVSIDAWARAQGYDGPKPENP